jgi:hypothetical protein
MTDVVVTHVTGRLFPCGDPGVTAKIFNPCPAIILFILKSFSTLKLLVVTMETTSHTGKTST